MLPLPLICGVIIAISQQISLRESHTVKDTNTIQDDKILWFFNVISRRLRVVFMVWIIYKLASMMEYRWLHSYELFGFFLVIAGDVIRSRAISELGQYFTYDISVTQEQTLVTTGPYKKLIHPSYTGLFMAWIGLCFYIENFAPYFKYYAAISGFFICILRIPKEERMLRQHFGQKWDKYASERYRLIPYVF
eukprot:TRINITY_DN5048_c0_g2_i2.p1 TRINITY_DN5048_c0_g2~~TRINITY_DN5048_c0_g2_i2.p1  ORF type:complete len:192 (+),score=19.26 TRINITY_DN5048_c0_g2_i2:184-759(+)